MRSPRCKNALTAAFQENLHLMGVIGLVMGLFEFLGLAFSFVLFSRIRKIYDDAREAALLNKAKELEAQGKIDVD
ncbi:MAG: hypothetical protein BJ554DRAFT_2099 [Olpidium bornovanus]|uniref:Uncharacterized protein n=1 Tax=Olpidium bornovanus TaxID=278681 RepID=A0A8H7ZR10_9FUNG|nr:MAG: hypothetical protein BJ554DRAFT_2099 [Olpidium bornovanus]